MVVVAVQRHQGVVVHWALHYTFMAIGSGCMLATFAHAFWWFSLYGAFWFHRLVELAGKGPSALVTELETATVEILVEKLVPSPPWMYGASKGASQGARREVLLRTYLITPLLTRDTWEHLSLDTLVSLQPSEDAALWFVRLLRIFVFQARCIQVLRYANTHCVLVLLYLGIILIKVTPERVEPHVVVPSESQDASSSFNTALPVFRVPPSLATIYYVAVRGMTVVLTFLWFPELLGLLSVWPSWLTWRSVGTCVLGLLWLKLLVPSGLITSLFATKHESSTISPTDPRFSSMPSPLRIEDFSHRAFIIRDLLPQIRLDPFNVAHVFAEIVREGKARGWEECTAFESARDSAMRSQSLKQFLDWFLMWNIPPETADAYCAQALSHVETLTTPVETYSDFIRTAIELDNLPYLQRNFRPAIEFLTTRGAWSEDPRLVKELRSLFDKFPDYWHFMTFLDANAYECVAWLPLRPNRRPQHHVRQLPLKQGNTSGTVIGAAAISSISEDSRYFTRRYRT